MRIHRVLAGVLTAMLPCFAPAQQDTLKEIERYRQLLQDGNPAELYEARGEELWKRERGPKNASLERCDLGLGPGLVKGAYVRLPRYFADTDRVQDLESRLVTCMVTLQGFTTEHRRADADDRSVFGRRPAIGDDGPRRLDRLRVARHEDRPLDVPSERASGLSSRRKPFLLPRRTV
jgi:hypothetical protein